MEIEATIGRPDQRRVIVASHERSGTHFLMNTIADNFGYVSDPWIDLDWHMVLNPFASDNFLHVLMMGSGAPVANLFKTHFPAEFFMPIMGWVLDHYEVFYIYRKYKPTMRSFCNHLNALSWNAGPKHEDWHDMAVSEPSGAILRYQARQIRSVKERWRQHVHGWVAGMPKQYRERIHYVWFADLNSRFEATVERMAQWIGPIRGEIRRPKRSERVITPTC